MPLTWLVARGLVCDLFPNLMLELCDESMLSLALLFQLLLTLRGNFLCLEGAPWALILRRESGERGKEEDMTLVWARLSFLRVLISKSKPSNVVNLRQQRDCGVCGCEERRERI